jgi:two-component system cell cycle response regulator DivK
MGRKRAWQGQHFLFYYTNDMKKTILIFDDDQEILFVCRVLLEKQNFHVETRTHCNNIIEDTITTAPVLILMDLWIPVIGGENAVHLLKNNEATKYIPVILFSANADIAEISKRVNADGFVRKPFDITAFTQIIEINIL